MELKLKKTYLDEFITVNNIDDNKISFISVDNEIGDYIIIDVMDEKFETSDINVEILTSELVDETIYALEMEQSQHKLDKKMFDTRGIVVLDNGKYVYMDQKSRIDVISKLLLIIMKPDQNKIFEWKSPNGVIELSVDELGEALMKSMQIREEFVIGKV